MTDQKLKQYIRYGYELETAQYRQRMIVNTLDSKIKALENDRGYAMLSEPAEDDSSDMFETLKVILYFVGAIVIGSPFIVAGYYLLRGIIGLLFGIGLGWIAVVVGIIVALAVALFASLVIGDIKSSRKSKVENENSRMQIRMQNEERRQKNVVILAENRKKISVLKQERGIAAEVYRNLQRTMTEYYNKGIIYQKYHNFVAMAAFYEYFESGRCDTLTGHEGAYNLFESEIRQNLIIAKLDDVLTQLSRIEDNQYSLYDAITESNRRVEKIGNDVSRGLKELKMSNELIENNTSISAHNNEVMKWMYAIKEF